MFMNIFSKNIIDFECKKDFNWRMVLWYEKLYLKNKALLIGGIPRRALKLKV